MRSTAFSRFFDGNVSSRFLFLAGAILLPAFLFQQDLGFRLLEVLLFSSLNGLRGKRIGLIQALTVGVGIVVFNLVIPSGRVLVSVLGLPVTEGALRDGTAKATAVVGMIALSRFSIRSDLRFPGLLGGLLGRSLFYFERIMAERMSVKRERIIASLDEVLLRVHGGGDLGERVEAEKTGELTRTARTTAAGFLFLASLGAAAWGACALSYLHPGIIWAR